MTKKTTVLLDDSIYGRLAEESLKKYGTTKAMSRVLNEILRKAMKDKGDIIRLIHLKKIAKTTSEEFEEFRKELSKRFEE
ncbi:MAG: hypothetical protein HYU39_07875 [Thaumarchaeota archaeon]|nr:hypothetical protein [Nitrososphaerota archaeon]